MNLSTRALTSQVCRFAERGRYFFFNAPNMAVGTLFPCYRVEIAGDRMILRMLDVAAMADDLKKHPGELKFEARQMLVPAKPTPATQSAAEPLKQPATEPDTESAESVVLTDEPAKIRDYLIRHQDDPAMFTEPIVLHRVCLVHHGSSH